MICLLLIMTVVFINGTESAEQRIKHSDTLLKEEEMNAKTKAWLLMVESGKMDQDEIRRITPKSIFIAPLLTSGAGKCQEGYRHDHLGQCVKVIKIDPKVQLELLLQRLNKLYAEKNEEQKEKEEAEEQEQDESKEKEEEMEVFEVSNGPLQFSLPIFNADEKKGGASQKQNYTSSGQHNINSKVNNNAVKVIPTAEIIPIPLPYVFLNQTNQTKEIESSGTGPLNDTEQFEASEFEGSGAEESGDKPLEEETMTASTVTLMSEENDYIDEKESESVTLTEIQSTTTQVPEELTTTEPVDVEKNRTESYQNVVNNFSVSAAVEPNQTVSPQKDIYLKPNSDRIVFPTDESFRIAASSSPVNSRIRFPDEPQSKSPSYQFPPNVNHKTDKYHSSAVLPEQFWWLPKNWQVDENQQNSALVKVWSRLPLIHDITFSQGTSSSLYNPYPPEKPYLQVPNTRYEDDTIYFTKNHQRTPSRNIKSFKNNRFLDILRTQNRDYRIQR